MGEGEGFNNTTLSSLRMLTSKERPALYDHALVFIQALWQPFNFAALMWPNQQ